MKLLIILFLLIPNICFASTTEIATPGTNIGIGTNSIANALTIAGGWAIGNSYTNITAPSNGAIIQGNVGIGSNNPGTQLDVAGTVRALFYQGNGSQLTGIPLYSQITQVGNNIGIGSTNPGQVLDVNGSVRANQFFGDGSQLTGISGSISGLTPGYLTDAATSSTLENSPVFRNGGNVGIATILPNWQLDMGTSLTGYIGLHGIGNNYWTAAGNHINALQRGINMGRMTGSGAMGFAGSNYTVPSIQDFAYFLQKGLTIWRLPFQWEFMQHVLNGSLDPLYLAQMDATVALAKQYGIELVLDCHNFGERTLYNDGGITENFTEAAPTSLSWPFATYTGAGNVILSSSGEAYFGTATNPVSPATGYAVSFNMKFNSDDGTIPSNDNFLIRPMHSTQGSTYYYEFGAVLNGTWYLSKVVNGITTVLQSGSQTWTIGTSYAVNIDINQTNAGFINVSLNGTPLFTNGTQAVDAALTNGFISFQANRSHVQLSSLVLNVNGDTSSGGITPEYRVGSSQVSIASLTNLWTQLATHYVNEPTVFAYDFMNEPNSMPVPMTSTNYLPTSAAPSTVTSMYLSLIAAVRAIDTNHWFVAEYDQFDGVEGFSTLFGANPTTLFWNDPQQKTMLSGHYYFDSNYSGTYGQAYTSTNFTRIPTDVTPFFQYGKLNGVPLYLGEFGVPNGVTSDDLNWQLCMDSYLQIADGYGNNISAAWNSFSPGSNNSLNLTPTSNYTTDRNTIYLLEKHLGFGLPNIPQYASTSGAIIGNVVYANATGGVYLAPNVGIGSTVPGQALDVVGTVHDIGELINGNAIVSNGNVGIGTLYPDEPLTVSGNAKIRGTNSFYFGNDYNAAIAASQNTTPDMVFTTHYVPDTSTGGTVTTNLNNTVRTFTTSGTFTPSFSGNIEVLAIAGGGGAGGNIGAGGGAGGVIHNTSYAVTSGSPITVTIGAHGAGGASGGTAANGNNTVFGSLTAVGGGHGGRYLNNAAGNGGSGGGGPGNTNTSGGIATAGQGNVGGNGDATAITDGGGGGCGAAGGNGSGAIPGNGGIGCQFSITGTSTYYAAGGYGCAFAPTSCGTPVLGDGTPGSGGDGVSSGTGNNGQDGEVIISYITPVPLETARFTSTGNVGIGSFAPSQALDVNGTVRSANFTLTSASTGCLQSTGGVVTSTGSSCGGGGGGSGLWETNNVGIDTFSPFVGIGSTNPGQKLDVQGTVRALFFVGNGSGLTGVSGSGTVNSGTAGQYAYYATSTTAVSNQNPLSTDGTNVGIGTTGPVSEFEVNGTVKPFIVDTNSNVGIGTTKTTNAALTVMNGNVGIGTWIPNQALDIGTNHVATITSGGAITAANLTLTGGVAKFTTTQLTGSNSTVFTVGNANATSGSFTYYIGGANANSHIIINPSSVTSLGGYVDIQAANVGIGTFDNAIRIIDGGNVGIGSASPGQALDVQGTIRFTNSLVNTKSSTGIGWSEHNATNQACNTTCGTSACVIGLDIGTVGVVNSGFVSCTDATADDCICAGP